LDSFLKTYFFKTWLLLDEAFKYILNNVLKNPW